MKLSQKINCFTVFLVLNSLAFTQSKDYDIYLYDSIKGMTLSVDNESLSLKALNLGKFILGEDLKYEEQNLNSKNNLINRLLLQSEIDVVDTQWEDSIELLDGQEIKIRFLYAKEDTLDYNKTKKIALLYRLDIKGEEKVSNKSNLFNLAVMESSIIKIWIDKESRSMVKLNLMYNGILYTIK
ncbi:hypothetical protein OAT31_01040 [Candidatus Marinimicrobia bacterium]|nr:hypothetical protein [Candidatus Neomarinimicrobiota bacterium]